MKIYVAAQFEQKKTVEKIYKGLIDKGHQIAGSWLEHKYVKPYSENQELCAEYSLTDIDGVLESDVFILISDFEGRGKFVEFGAALASYKFFGHPKVFVVGKSNSDMMFYFHPAVTRRSDVEEVLTEL